MRAAAGLIALSLAITGTARAADGDVQTAYDGFVKAGIPGLSIDLVQQAKQEGTVTLYSLLLLDGAVADFSKLFPFVHVNHVKLTGAVLSSRIAAERGAGKKIQDVIATDEATARTLVAQKQCLPYTPTSDQDYPDSTKIPGIAYPWDSAELVIAFNTSALNAGDQAALKHATWDTLADARWKGKKFGWNDVTAGFTTGTLPNYYFYTTYGADFYRKHVALGGRPQLYASGGPLMSAMTQGEIDMSGPLTLSSIYPTWIAGAPVGWTVPTPILAGNELGCILTDPPHPAAAKLFWEYLLSVQGQVIQATLGNLSARKDVDPAAGLPAKLTGESWFAVPDVGKVYHYQTQDILDHSGEMIKTFQSIINGK